MFSAGLGDVEGLFSSGVTMLSAVSGIATDDSATDSNAVCASLLVVSVTGLLCPVTSSAG